MLRAEQAIKKIQGHIVDKNILEVACGCAEFSIAASKIAKTVICIDLDDFRLNKEIFECRNITFEKMDATALTYADGAMDTVVIYNAIAHLETIIPNVLNECLRVLKPDGYIYIISSFKMDKCVIVEYVILFLTNANIQYELYADKIFVYLKIHQ